MDFTPKRTQVRLLRQGLTSKPYWIVSLSRPGTHRGTFRKLAVVRINANTGKVQRRQAAAESKLLRRAGRSTRSRADP